MDRDTSLRSVAPAGWRRTALLTAIRQLAGGLPDDLLSTVSNFGEAHEWCAVRLRGDRGHTKPAESDDSGPRVQLRPVMPSDLPVLYEAALRPGSAFRWRMRGATPTTRDFEELLYRGVLCHLIVRDIRTNENHGLVAAYNARFDNGTAYVALHRISAKKGHGEVTEGLSYFIEYLFQTWNFRKLYAEIPAYNLDQIVDDMSLLLREEGRLIEHEYHADRWWDLVMLAIYRESWREFYSPWMKELGLNGISDSIVYMGEGS